MAQLRITFGGSIQVITLGREATIGRAIEHAVCVPNDAAISRDHARLALVEGVWVIEDLESRNGTYVERDGRISRVTVRMLLVHGDTIRAGEAVIAFEAPEIGGQAAALAEAEVTTMIGRILPTPRE